MNELLLGLQLSELANKPVVIENGFCDSMGTTNSVSSSLSNALYNNGSYTKPFTLGSYGFISESVGTLIGNMVESGGLVAAFDGVTIAPTTPGCARISNSTGFCGKDFSSNPKAIDYVDLYPSSNYGFGYNSSTDVTLTLYGKNGSAPSSETDGTILASETVADYSSGYTTIQSNDTDTLWDFVWVQVSQPTSSYVYFAEIKMYEPVVASIDGMTIISESFSFDTAKDNVTAIVELIENEDITINTDAVFLISRDGGTTFTLATLSPVIINNKKVCYSADIDLSLQPSGTDMIYRFETFGKDIEFSGVGIVAND